MSIQLIIGGVLAIGISNGITSSILGQLSEDPRRQLEIFDRAAGKGLVPAWVSLINVGGWLALATGVLELFRG